MHASLGRREFTFGAAAFAATLAADTSSRASNAPPLRAGVAETVVTPAALGTFLIGPMKPSTGVHDDLFARALVLAGADRQIAILTLDYLGFDFAYTEQLLRAASQASGIPLENILLNCSHTHSAPLTAPWGPWQEHRHAAFFDWLPRKLGEVAKQAVDRLQPATLRVRREPTQIGFNRRLLSGDKIVMAPNPQGAVLPWVDVLAVDG